MREVRFWQGAALALGLPFLVLAGCDFPGVDIPPVDPNATVTCIPKAFKCGTNSDCCGALSCNENKICSDGSCFNKGTPCSVGTDCCGTLSCTAGICSDGGCFGQGSFCNSPSDCCGTLSCINGVCSDGGCFGLGLPCTTSGDCCGTLTCDQNGGFCH